MQVFTLKYSRS